MYHDRSQHTFILIYQTDVYMYILHNFNVYASKLMYNDISLTI